MMCRILLIIILILPSFYANSSQWDLAITFNDLSISDKERCKTSDVLKINEKILSILNQNRISSVGYLITGLDCAYHQESFIQEVAQQWLSAGQQVGNATHTYPDLNTGNVKLFLDDLTKAHQYLEPILVVSEQEKRWFRAPYLHLGNHPEKKKELDNWLKVHAYSEGVVTILSKEKVYAKAYDNALALEKKDVAHQVAKDYLLHLKESIEFYNTLSHTVANRQISQILQLHINQLNADYLQDVLSLLKDMSANIVTVEQALDDPVYRNDNFFVGNPGVSWLFRWAFTQWIDADIETIPQWHDWIWDLATNPK